MTARKPTGLKIIQGTFRKDRARAEPVHAPSDRRPPKSLSKMARRYWSELAPRLIETGLLTEADRNALALTCEALAQHQSANAVVAALGYTYEAETESGAILYRERAEVRIAADAWRRALRGLAEFGLTPASRGRVEASAPAKANPFADL